MTMVVKSDSQLRYLASSEGTNSLRVLLFDDFPVEAIATASINEQVPLIDRTLLDSVLLNVSKRSKHLAWLKLSFTDATMMTDSTAAHTVTVFAEST
jgi:hypothetical protein